MLKGKLETAVGRRTILRAAAAAGIAQVASPFIIAARGEEPVKIGLDNPATGTYVGPDGHVYTQSNLAQDTPKEHTWQTMLTPPTSN